MNQTLTPELYWLTLSVAMTAVLWLPYIVNRIIETGPWATLSVPKLKPEAAWAERLMRAHANAVENLAVFVPLVLAVQLSSMNTAITSLACMAYFFARVIHVLAYVAAVPVVRTLAFSVGFASQMALVLCLLGMF
jgi:uncharacterized MAPEG superfamily protein